MSFPKDFIWGAAAASYQVEGAPAEDGKGESVWDRFAHTKGKIKDNETGDVACDHYHRYKEDVAIMKQIGLKGYRLSMAWPRLFPSGKGKLNPKGLDFYKRLTDELIKNGIEPFITLFHWDLPQALQDKGGWANRDTAYYFRDYAACAARELGDRVKYWMTLNEPGVYVSCGNLIGVHAPGIKDPKTAFAVSHYELLGHGEAIRAMRRERRNLKIGVALSIGMRDPASDDWRDKEAAERAADFYERWYFDGIFRGKYPERMTKGYPELMPEIPEGDMAVVSTPVDWLGINNYSRGIMAHDEAAGFLKSKGVKPGNAEFTDFNWEVYPEGIYRVLKWASESYGRPDIYITENGASYGEGPDESGRVRDDRRVSFLRRYLEAARRAVSEGVKLKGYFVWSIMDNFEWGEGFTQRFGIVHVEYATQKRTPKDSALWYRGVIASNGADL